MSRDPRYDILFTPLTIGPVTTKNRFFQVPHCTGMGYIRPRMLASMREVKAEGGWGVICTDTTQFTRHLTTCGMSRRLYGMTATFGRIA